jgi:transcriptional regulator with XRE-family HTH domain
MTLDEAVAIRLKQLLEDKHWNGYTVQKEGGVPRSTVGKIISQQRSAKLSTIYQISSTLGISIREFFDDTIFDEVTD